MKNFLKWFILSLTFIIFAVYFTACGKKLDNSESVDVASIENDDKSTSPNLTPTADKYFDFIYIEETDTYSIKAKDKNNLPEKVVIPSEHNGKKITHIGYDFADAEMTEDFLSKWGFDANSLENTNYAFVECNGIKEIIIPKGVTHICFGSIAYCSNLSSIVIPESVISIGIWAFFGNNNLTTISIPNSVKNIGNFAFGNCNNLVKVFIGNGVSKIGYSVFEFCNNLNSINFGGTKMQWNKIIKNNDWKLQSNINYVICIDGDLTTK